MKKAAIGAALAGLLFVGCAATQPQDPPARQATEGETGRFVWGTGIRTEGGVQARFELDKRNFGISNLPSSATPQDPPRFRDLLRGRLGQECEVFQQDGVWTLTFTGPGQNQTLGDEAVHRRELEQRITAVQEELNEVQEGAERTELMRELIRLHSERKDRTVAVQNLLTVVAVGDDFIQLREADGTERYIPLSRVDVVVEPGK